VSVTVIANRVARITLALAAGLAGALAFAVPASAHGADAPDGTDYRTTARALTPAMPGLTVRAIESGARLELTNRTGRTIEVLGYHGEPYLEVRPDGVYQNVYSPATYLNQTLDGETEPPATADPTVPPSWQRISTEPVVRWHDQRTHWLEPDLPPQVRTDPQRQHRIRDWTVPLRDNMADLEIRGTLDWLPPPDPVRWWMVTALGALLVGALGLLPNRSAGNSPAADPAGQPRAAIGFRAGTTALGALLATGGLAALAFAVARQADAGAGGVGGVLLGLLTGQTWAVLTGLGALAAGAYALVQRSAGNFALALAGACLALFAGVSNAALFSRSVAPVPGPADWARIAIAVVIGAGAGVTAAAVLRLRATSGPGASGQRPAASRAAATLGSKP
jgi:hypothetical protein